MGVNATYTLATAAPWKRWRSPNAKVPTLPDYEDPDEYRPILHLDITSPLSLSEPTPTQLYGSTHIGEGSSSMGSSIVRRDSLSKVLEEETPAADDGQGSLHDDDDDDEWELEKQGLYRGSYFRITALYTLVPLTSALAFALLILLQVFAFPLQLPDSYPYPKYFPFPLPELLASASFWSLSHLLRVPLHSFFFFFASSPTPAVLLSTLFHVMLHNLLRLAAFPLLLLRQHMVYAHPTWHDPSFRRVWWVALGWSFAEVVVGISQGYEQISLYRDVLVPKGKDEEFVVEGSPHHVAMSPTIGIIDGSNLPPTARCEGKGKQPRLPETKSRIDNPQSNGIRPMSKQSLFDGALGVEVDRDLDYLMVLKAREELEEVYGIPFIRIPVFISCLLRLDSIILSLGLTLLLSASYLHASISLSDSPRSHLLHETHFEKHHSTNHSFYITFPIVVALHLFLSFLHTPLVLPRIGVHTSAYVGLLVGLGSFFAGLGVWEALS